MKSFVTIATILLASFVSVPFTVPFTGTPFVPASCRADDVEENEVEEDDLRSEVGDTMREWIYKLTRVHLAGTYERNHHEVKAAFADVTAAASRSTVRIMCDQTPAAMGAIVDANGFILSKSSELSGNVQCILHDKRRFDARIVARNPETDLALLKIEARELTPVRWSKSSDTPPVGSLLATPEIAREPLSIGIVSVAPRPIAAPKAMLGVSLEPSPNGVRVQRVVSGSSADKAGVRGDDLIKSLNGKSIKDHESLIREIQSSQPGDEVKLTITRGSQEFAITAVLGDASTLTQGERAVFQNSLGGPLSRRRAGFPSVLQHDSVLRPTHCGGPIVDLDGYAVGINIARAGRVESYALPTSVVLPVLEQMKAAARSETVVVRMPEKDPTPPKTKM